MGSETGSDRNGVSRQGVNSFDIPMDFSYNGRILDLQTIFREIRYLEVYVQWGRSE